MKTFEIPLLPESVNRAYTIDIRRKTLVMTRRAWKKKSDMHIFIPRIEIKEGQLLKLEYEYHADWFFKNGSLRRRDAQNFDKMLLDVICEKQGVDDSIIIEWRGRKVQDSTEFVLVNLYIIERSVFDGKSSKEDPKNPADGSKENYGSLWD